MVKKSKLSATIERTEITDEKPVTTAHFERNHGRLSTHDLIENITKSKMVFKNWKYPGAENAFPGQPDKYTCEQFYPKAEGGALFVDEPEFESEWEDCKKKRKAIEAHGLRYLVMGKKPDGTYVDVIEAMDQLGLK